MKSSTQTHKPDLYQILREKDSKLNQAVNNKNGILQGKNRDHYSSIPNNYEKLSITLRKLFLQIHDKKKMILPKFLDVGCGFGTTLMLAEAIGYDGYGIEYNQKNKPFASTRLIWYGDAFDYENENEERSYSQFDVIYYYRPISDYDLQLKLESLIEDKMSPGAFLIASYKQDHTIETNPNFKIIKKEAWTYGLTYITQKIIRPRKIKR